MAFTSIQAASGGPVKSVRGNVEEILNNNCQVAEYVMTWYAQQLFAEPNSGVIEALRDLLGLSNAIYYVPHLLDMQTEEQVADGILLRPEAPVNILRTIRGGPRLPPKGLLVVRELCASG